MALPVLPTGTPDEVSDELRLALIADLDSGFADLVRAHERVVYSVALQCSRHPADAEDVAAEALLRAYRALRGYDAERIASLRVRPWLLTIVRNVARNAARDAARRPDPPSAFEPADQPSIGPSVEQLVEHDDVAYALRSALAALPEAQRSAVVLRHVVGLATTEVAEIMSCPDGTAKSHIGRGLQRLRAQLTQHSSAIREGQFDDA